MDHGYFQDRLSAYHDRSLTPEEMRMLEEHVAACAECRAQLERLAKLDRLIDEKADLAESDYWETSAQKIEQRLGFKEESKVTTIRRSWAGLSWKLAAAAASVAALTFIALHEGDILDSADRRMQDSPTVSAPVARDMPVTHWADSLDQRSYHRDTPIPEDKEVRTELVEPAPAHVTQERAGAMDAQAQPETVDELLEQVVGTVTNSSGEIFVRGGRAGEVDYIVDGIPSETREQGDIGVSLTTADEAMEEKRDIGKTITVTGQRDIIEKFEVSNQTVITHESLETTDDMRSLDHWRMVRDSLHTQISTGTLKKQLSAEKSTWHAAQPAETPPSPAPPDSASTRLTPLELYLEACYHIALQTEDESEYDDAVVVLTEHARHKESSSQKLAHRYLKLLEDFHK